MRHSVCPVCMEHASVTTFNSSAVSTEVTPDMLRFAINYYYYVTIILYYDFTALLFLCVCLFLDCFSSVCFTVLCIMYVYAVYFFLYFYFCVASHGII